MTEGLVAPDDTHLAFYSRSSSVSKPEQRDIGNIENSSWQLIIQFNAASSQRSYYRSFASSTGVENQDNKGLVHGLFQGTRQGNVAKIYRNGIAYTSSIGNGSIASLPGTVGIFRATANLAVTPGTLTQYSEKILSYYSIGKAMNDAQAMAFYNRVQTLQQALGRAV